MVLLAVWSIDSFEFLSNRSLTSKPWLFSLINKQFLNTDRSRHLENEQKPSPSFSSNRHSRSQPSWASIHLRPPCFLQNHCSHLVFRSVSSEKSIYSFPFSYFLLPILLQDVMLFKLIFTIIFAAFDFWVVKNITGIFDCSKTQKERKCLEQVSPGCLCLGGLLKVIWESELLPWSLGRGPSFAKRWVEVLEIWLFSKEKADCWSG